MGSPTEQTPGPVRESVAPSSAAPGRIPPPGRVVRRTERFPDAEAFVTWCRGPGRGVRILTVVRVPQAGAWTLLVTYEAAG